MPKIVESIQRRPVNHKILDNWNYLWNEFSLADDLPSERETSSVELGAYRKRLLLGHYISKKMKVRSGLYILGSKHGWILSEIVERTTDPNMLMLTHGKGIEMKQLF